MDFKRLLCFVLTVITFSACVRTNSRYVVIGNIAGLPQQTVVLEQLNADNSIRIVDSQKSNVDGHFELSGIVPEPGLYRLHFHPNKFILLSLDKGRLKIDGSWASLENYKVSGSPESAELKTFLDSLREHLCDFNTMSIVMDSLQVRGNDSVLTVARKNFQGMRQQFTQFVEHYADTTHFMPNAIFAANILVPSTEVNYLDAFTQSLGRRFPSSHMSRDYVAYRLRQGEKQRREVSQARPANEGQPAPEVMLTDASGKQTALSSFRGKYVLLDFWASWCAPCRAENPNVVAAFHKFKDQNFTIVSVSLDNNKEAWLSAVKSDGLSWFQASDLKGWSSPIATAYSVESIPANFLIDPKGRIVAHNLRGNQLYEALQEILGTH